MEIHSNKDSQRKVASAEQFIKVKVYSLGERVGRFLEVEPALWLFWDWIFVVSLGWEEFCHSMGVFSNGSCF